MTRVHACFLCSKARHSKHVTQFSCRHDPHFANVSNSNSLSSANRWSVPLKSKPLNVNHQAHVCQKTIFTGNYIVQQIHQ